MIENALKYCNDTELHADAEYILTDKTRKKVYDRNHRMLNTISDLRSQLELGGAPHWQSGVYEDFHTRSSAEESHRVRRTSPILEKEWPRFWIVFSILIVIYTILYFTAFR